MLIIDRFEGDFAVVEYEQGKTFNLPRCLLPPGVKEGDVVRITLTVDSRKKDYGLDERALRTIDRLTGKVKGGGDHFVRYGFERSSGD